MNSGHQHPRNFSTAEQANQVSEQMQLAVFERNGNLAQKGLYLLAAVMFGLLLWSGFAESDVCAEASGRLEPRVRVQEIRPTSDGTIAEYRVHDGQTVKKGDLLILLNTVKAEAELVKKQQELTILETELKAHENAVAGLEKIITSPQDMSRHSLALPDVERLAGELYASKKALDTANYDVSTKFKQADHTMTPQMAVLQVEKQRLNLARQARNQALERKAIERAAEQKKIEARIAMLENNLRKAQAELADMEAILADAKEEMKIYERGRQLGVASEVKFLDVQNYVHQRELLVAQQKLQIASLEQELSAERISMESSNRAYNADKADLGAGVKAAEARIASIPLDMNEAVRSLENKQASYETAAYRARTRYSNEITEVNKLQREITACQAAISLLQQQLSEKHLVAPVDGKVTNLVHLLPGEMVLRGQPLATVVPSNQELVLRATVNNTDVGFVEVGQRARLRFTAFPCEEFGIIPGTVIRVGDYPEERIEKQKKISVYRVTIKLSQTYIASGHRRFNLEPGLQAYADIVLRKRSLLALLFDPLLKMGNV